MHIAKVIVNLSLDKTFDYLIPAPVASQVRIGVLVEVPFGHTVRQGYVLGLAEQSDFPNLKSIIRIHTNHPVIPQSLIDLGRWMSEYYCCSRESAVKNLLPGAVRGGKIQHKQRQFYFIQDIEKVQEYIADHGKRAKVKTEILKLLVQRHELTSNQIMAELKCSVSTIEGLVKNGLVGKEKRDIARNPFADMTIVPSLPQKPTEEQQAALDQVDSLLNHESKHHVLMLHGVTGSGKTEVYLQAIAKVLAKGQETIVLVPEISLTPQTVERFRARFGDQVSVLHSGLSDGERFDEWTKIYEAKVKIVVGARSALFAPFTDLGLIIVDEEHENSYKQDKSPRYHARDVAVMRGHMEKALVILGSATPSFESYHNAQTGKYKLAPLTKRVEDIPMPSVQVIDSKLAKMQEGGSALFSKQLIEEIRIRLDLSEQVILFLNRRGFARQLQCSSCGYVAQCSECSISYTYHRNNQSLTCHLCGEIVKAPETCPDCGAADIRYSGFGTEKIESVAFDLFPGAVIRRMDSDTMTRKDSYRKVLDEFRRGNIDILIGTQMIAKGLHFPNVTLVGVINADMSLYMPDFRAIERTFQLLTQVSGRAGRGDIKGLVMIQTYSPFNPAIQYAIESDYTGFYEDEIEIRKELNYPPCAHLYVIHVHGEDEKAVAQFTEIVMTQLTPALHREISVSAPAPAPLARIKNRYRYMIVFRGEKMLRFRKTLRHLLFSLKKPKNVDWYVDIDAINLM